MQNKRIVWILVTVFVLLLAINKVYYTFNPNQVSIDATKLSIVEEATGRLSLIDKHTDEGRSIINKLYGSYSKYLQNDELYISTPTSAEYTVPQIELKNKAYVVREHPNLRYELWKREAPDVILLGSSIFFCDFNKEVFFKKYPNKNLLDFTTGNNTPYISHYFLSRADSLHLPIKSGAVVLYGMNRVELLQGYKDAHAHDFVKQTLENGVQEPNPDEQIATYLRIPELRYDMLNMLKYSYDDIFRSGNVYRKEVSKKHTQDENAFIAYQKSVAPPSIGKNEIEEARIEEIRQIGKILKRYNSQLVVLKLPQSLYNDIAMNTEGYSYFDSAMQQIKSDNISYIDVSDFKEYNIKQMDYLWPGNIFDPEHLNVQGAKRYTEALLKNVVDSLLTKQQAGN